MSRRSPRPGPLFAIIMLQKPGEDVVTRIRRGGGKLDEKGGEKVSDMLFIKISEVDTMYAADGNPASLSATISGTNE